MEFDTPDYSDVKIISATGGLIAPFEPRIEWLRGLNYKWFVPAVLAGLPRFGNQTGQLPYSVAQHSLTLLSVLDDPVHQRWALGHEVFEALTGMDVLTPLKNTWPAYIQAEDETLAIFANIYELPFPIPDEVKEADFRVGVAEAKWLFPETDWDALYPGTEPIKASWPPIMEYGRARGHMTDRWKEIMEPHRKLR